MFFSAQCRSAIMHASCIKQAQSPLKSLGFASMRAKGGRIPSAAKWFY